MDFKLTEEQAQIKALVRQFCKREVDKKQIAQLAEKAATAKTVEELRSIRPCDLLEKLYEVGLSQFCVPVEYGGGGITHGGYLTRAIAAEEAGYTGGLVGFIIACRWMFCNLIATGNTTKEQQDWFFKQFMENRHMFMTMTISEPSGGTDIHTGYDEPVGTLKTLAYKDGDEWVINGDKMYSDGGGVADLIQCAARTDKEGPVTQSMSFFWVPRDTPGLSVAINEMMLPDMLGNAQINYSNVRVPESHLIGEVNKGYSLLVKSLTDGTTVQAVILGQVQGLYEQIREYAEQRIQGGRPIIQHSHIAAMLGEVATTIEALRAFLYKSCWEMDQQEKSGKPISLFWAQGDSYLQKKLSLRLCEVAAEVYGGIAGSIDLPIQKFICGTYGSLAAGLPTCINAIMCSRQYDDR